MIVASATGVAPGIVPVAGPHTANEYITSQIGHRPLSATFIYALATLLMMFYHKMKHISYN